MGSSNALVMDRDGEILTGEEARRIWTAFSDHMEAAGPENGTKAMDAFAASIGYRTARPSHAKGKATLVLRSR